MDDHHEVGQQPVDHRPLSSWSRVLGALPLVAVAIAYAWWATALRPFTWPALAAVAVAGVAAIAVGARRRRGPAPVPGAVTWAVLVALLAGWELAAYFQHPRAEHPTLSSLANEVLDWRPARVLAFLLWTVVGADLARR